MKIGEAGSTNSNGSTFFGVCLAINGSFGAIPHIASALLIHYTSGVEYPFPPVGIVGAADGKNRRAFFFLHCFLPVADVDSRPAETPRFVIDETH